MLELTILILACLINGLLGLVVYVKNPTSATNKLFIALTGSFILWSLANYISVHPYLLPQLDWIRLVLFNASLLCFTVFLTFLTFPRTKIPKRHKKLVKFAAYFTLIVMGLTLTPLVFKSLNITNGKASPVPAPGIGLFMIQTVSLLVAGIASLVIKYRHANQVIKSQLRFIMLGLSGTFVLILITNLILVVAFNYSGLVPFGPAYTLVFSGAFAYAIIKHKLFDIRSAVARSVAYLLILGTLSLTYGILLFGVLDVILPGQHNTTERQFISILLVPPFALSFQAVKRFFDKTTNRIFYRVGYDFQDVLDKVGGAVVAEIELHKILNEVEEILYSSLRTSFVEFILFKQNKPYFESYPNRVVNQASINLSKHITQQKRAIVLADDLSPDNPLKSMYEEADTALSLKLVANNEIVGYLLLGHKRSGGVFSSQDKNLLVIIADEISLAIQNALRFEEIQNFNITLQERINDATQKLRNSNAKLKALDETKDDFISMASHQLRTPLTSIKGYLSMVLEGDAGELNKKQTEMLNQAFFSSQRMVYLISDMLNISRLKNGKFIIESSPVNLNTLISEEISQLEQTAGAKDIKIIYNKPDSFPDLNLDETKIRQVIMNFADNAIYYTPQGGTIQIELLNKEHSIELRVKDNGIGVPRHEQHRLFTKFYRATNARKARPDGTGLGLFMAKSVIDAQGGGLLFESTEGKGSTFGFVFPKNAKLLAS